MTEFSLQPVAEVGPPTSNIIISFRRDQVFAFRKAKTFNELIEKLDDTKDTFFFTTKSSNLLKFVHDYSFSNEEGGAGAGPSVTLEFIDPENLFENKIREIGAKIFRDRKTELFKEIETRKQYQLSLESELEILQKDIKKLIDIQKEKSSKSEPIEDIVQLFERAGEGILESIFGDETEQAAIQEITRLKNLIKQKKDLLNNLQNSNFDLIQNTNAWITYGCGNNLSTWCKPFFMVLNRAEYIYNPESGVRKIILGFIPVNSAFTPLLDENFGIGTVISPRPVPFFTYTPFFRETLIIDLQKAITQSYKNYFNSVIKENVIIAFPNLNDLLKNKLKNHLERNSRSSESPREKVLASYQSLFQELGFEVLDIFKQVDSLTPAPEEVLVSSINTSGGVLPLALPLSFDFEIMPRRVPKSLIESSAKKVLVEHVKALRILCSKQQTYGDPIRKIKKELEEDVQSTLPLKIIGRWETDTEILSIFQKYGLIEDPLNPCFIYGDNAFIERHLYCRKSLESIGLNFSKADSSLLDTFFPSEFNRINQSDYINEITSVMYGKDRTSCFDALSQNTFGAVDQNTQEQVTKQLLAANIPVFKSGVNNSNILSLRISSDNRPINIFRALLTSPDLTFADQSGGGDRNQLKLLEKILENISEDQLKKLIAFNDPDNDQVRQEVLTIIGESLGIDIKLNDMKLDDKVNAVLNLLLNGIEQSNGHKLPADPFGGSNTLTRIFNMFNRVIFAARTGRIKTVPLFNISTAFFGFPALVLVRENRVVSNIRNFNPFNSNLTGWWSIFGFTHTISPTNVHSEFTIFQDGNAAAPPAPQEDLIEEEETLTEIR